MTRPAPRATSRLRTGSVKIKQTVDSEMSSPRRRRGLVAVKSNGETSDLSVSTSAERLAGDTSYTGLVTQAGEVVDALNCFVDLMRS